MVSRICLVSSSLFSPVSYTHLDVYKRQEFNRLCNCLSEYGRQEKAAPGGEAFLEEHCELIVKDHALQAFGRI